MSTAGYDDTEIILTLDRDGWWHATFYGAANGSWRAALDALDGAIAHDDGLPKNIARSIAEGKEWRLQLPEDESEQLPWGSCDAELAEIAGSWNVDLAGVTARINDIFPGVPVRFVDAMDPPTTAYHEGGHAVVGYYLGLEPRLATLGDRSGWGARLMYSIAPRA